MQLPGTVLTVNEVIKLCVEELERANKKHPLFHCRHHGYAVIKEELDELWNEIKERNPNNTSLQHECIQTMTMCLKFLISPKVLEE